MSIFNDLRGSFPLKSRYSNRILPQVYDDSLSFEELIYEMFYKVKEIEDFEEQMKKIEQLIKNFDETVSKEVKAQIQKMYDNGELQAILKDLMSKYLREKLAAKTSQLSTVRVARYFHLMKKSQKVNANSYKPNWLQGCTMRKLANGNYVFIGAYSDNGKESDAATYTNDMQVLKYPNALNSRSNYQSTKYHFGHGNGMCYDSDNDYYYVAHWTYYKSGEKIRTPDYSISRFKTDGEVFYTAETKKFTSFHTPDLAYYKGKLYAYDYDHHRVVTFDWTSGTVKEVVKLKTLIDPNSTFKTPLCFDVQNDMIFMVYDNHEIGMYDLETGDLIWVYSIPILCDNDKFIIPEIEGIRVFPNGDMFLMTQGYNGSKGQCQQSQTSIFKANYITNYVNPTADAIVQQGAMNAGMVVYVNPNSTNVNPNGRSVDGGFRNMNEAIEFINNAVGITGADIYLCDSEAQHVLNTQIVSNKSINIVGCDENGVPYPVTGNKRVTCGGFYIRNSNNVSMQCLTIKNSLVGSPACVNTENSNVYTTRCNAGPSGSSDGWYCTTAKGIRIAGSGLFAKYLDDNFDPVDRKSGAIYFDGSIDNITKAFFDGRYALKSQVNSES